MPVVLFALSATLLVLSCRKEENPVASYDRSLVLNNLADNYIVPAYANYASKAAALKVSSDAFAAAPSESLLDQLIKDWKEALLAWQDVAFLEFGPAGDLSLRAATNIYPIDTSGIRNNITSGSYDLALPDNYKKKGFQALDFLLHQPGLTKVQLVDYFKNNANGKKYLTDVSDELSANAQTVSSKWSTTYTTTFKASNSSNSSGSSIAIILNELSLHYETYVRKGKLGLPSGAFNGFSKQPMPDHVEAFYSQSPNAYLLRSVESIQKFFNGVGFTSGENGSGFDDYLNGLDSKKDGVALSSVISAKMDEVESNVGLLTGELSSEVVNNKDAVSKAYTSMQELVPLLKVDLTSALGVLIEYQDTDGD